MCEQDLHARYLLHLTRKKLHITPVGGAICALMMYRSGTAIATNHAESVRTGEYFGNPQRTLSVKFVNELWLDTAKGKLRGQAAGY